MDRPPMPGDHHPALDREAALLATVAGDRHTIQLPVHRRLVVAADGSRVTLSQRTFTRRQAYGSLLPQYGAYVWTVWTDDLGRHVAMDDTRYEENPTAAVIYGEWNPSLP